MAWAFDDEKPVIWTPTQNRPMPGFGGCAEGELPGAVIQHVQMGGALRAHNAQFERIMWREVMEKLYGAPRVALEQWYCSAAQAAAMSLPRHLAGLTQVLKLRVQKDLEGAKLMKKMCKPRKIMPDGKVVWWDTPEMRQRLGEYCITDVISEQGASKCLRPLSALEREVYLLDQTINDRGIRIDRELIEAMRDVADVGIDRANTSLSELTGGYVTAVTNHQRLRQWLNDNGVETTSTDKDAVKEMLEGDLTPKVRFALQLRADAGRSSLAKLDSMLKCADDEDDRVRGTLFYHGAGTGRWTAKLIQPQNFPRGSVDNIESFIGLMHERDFDKLNLFYHPLELASSMLRSTLCAAEGHELIAADYSGIEMRVLNWAAGQEDVLAALRAGRDPYRVNAARFYHTTYEKVTAKQRQTGKFAELGFGFGMGSEKARDAADTAQYGYLKLSSDEAESLKLDYRNSHDRVVAYWHAAENSVMEAVRTPGVPVAFGPPGREVKALVAGAYLYIVLPSKRPLMYASPRIENIECPWSTKKNPAFRDAVVFSGVDSFTKKWERSSLYGGLIVENIVQGIARDIMAAGMLRTEDSGYPNVMCVHDEIVAEVPAGSGSVKEFEDLLCVLPAWATGLPVKAEGWRSERYRK